MKAETRKWLDSMTEEQKIRIEIAAESLARILLDARLAPVVVERFDKIQQKRRGA